jgi:hypothetical protein
MVQTFALDSRLPVPDGMSDNDPSHPANVMRGALIVQNQAVADTKYDPYPPPRLTREESEQKEKETRAEELRRRPVPISEPFANRNGKPILMCAGLIGLLLVALAAVLKYAGGTMFNGARGNRRYIVAVAILSAFAFVAYRMSACAQK